MSIFCGNKIQLCCVAHHHLLVITLLAASMMSIDKVVGCRHLTLGQTKTHTMCVNPRKEQGSTRGADRIHDRCQHALTPVGVWQ